MRRRLSFALCIFVSLANVATADNSAPPLTVSTASVSTSTTSFATPDVSTTPVVPLIVSTSTMSIPDVSSVTVPVDHVENVYLRRFVGTIQTVDSASYKIALEGRDGKTSEFILTKRTRVATDDGHRVNVSVLKAGDHVMIRYVENYNYVRKIDILPAVQ